MDYQKALSTYHWLFLAQPAPLPETLIGHDSDFYLEHLLNRWAGDRAALNPQAVAAYARDFRKPEVIQATCEDYRAGMSVDLAHDRADRDQGKRIECPLLVLWGRDYLGDKTAAGPLAIWRDWAANTVHEVALDCGHFIAEERPQACADAIREFCG